MGMYDHILPDEDLLLPQHRGQGFSFQSKGIVCSMQNYRLASSGLYQLNELQENDEDIFYKDFDIPRKLFFTGRIQFYDFVDGKTIEYVALLDRGELLWCMNIVQYMQEYEVRKKQYMKKLNQSKKIEDNETEQARQQDDFYTWD